MEKIMPKRLKVNAFWDNEAGVWVASSDNVPGLATEADTVEQLLEKLRVMIPELLAENSIAAGDPIVFDLETQRSEVVHRHAA
jgi:predicted RNase H-like HicB family nuclease